MANQPINVTMCLMNWTHIQQKLPAGDCGIACIGMITGTTYERVMESVAPDSQRYGLWYAEVLHALLKITCKRWYLIEQATDTIINHQPTIKDFGFQKEPTMYGILRPDAGFVFHYVASDGVSFSDPLLPNAISLEEAKTDYHASWIIVGIIRST